MTEDEAVQQLGKLPIQNEGRSHEIADDILLRFLDESGCAAIAAAYREWRERIGFWYA